MAYPKKYEPNLAPAAVQGLIDQLLPQLLEGDHPALAALRDQCRAVGVSTVELTGVGFFAELFVSSDAPVAEPPRFAGGNANIALRGVEHGAGCVLFVENGRLSLFEGYTYAGEEWAEDAEVLSVDGVMPIQPPEPPS